MGLSSVLSQLFERRPRRPTLDQLKLLREVIARAYDVSSYIVGAGKRARTIALRALAGLMDDCDVLKHRVTNQGSYRHSIWTKTHSQTRVRKVPLPFDLELAARIFSITPASEKEIAEERPATQEDFDVWFCKCVLLQSLSRRNAFSALMGISNFVHSYTKEELMSLFYTLGDAIPRVQESWDQGNEPLNGYLKEFERAVADRFGDSLNFDTKRNLIRRVKSEQPQELITECILILTLQEVGASCLTKPINSDNLSSNDIESELRRLHIVLHQPCYTEIAGDAGLPNPKEKTGMPEYTTMLTSNGNKTRKAPPLQEEELDMMVDEFQHMLEARRKAATKAIITVDGTERELESTQLDESGHAHLHLNETARIVEVWAREDSKADVLLTAFFLSLSSDRRIVNLEAGQEITFGVDYSESAEGNGSFDVNVGYRETNIARRLQLSGRRRAARKPARAPIPWYAQPEVLVTSLVVLLAVGGFVVERFYGVGGRFVASIRSMVPRVKPSIPGAEQPGQTKAIDETHLNGSFESEVPGKGQFYRHGGANRSPSPATTAGGPPSEGSTPQLRSPATASRTHRATHVAATIGTDRTLKAHVPSLANIRGVYVQNIGIYDSAKLNSQAYLTQIDALRQSGMFQPKENPNEAEARLVMVSDFEGATGDKAQAQLVTTKGGLVIWYGPLLSITRDSNQELGTNEIKTLVGQSTKALMTKKENALRRHGAPVRRKRALKHSSLSPKE
jgi:hypothetical protein